MKRIFLVILLLLFCVTNLYAAADSSATAKTQALLQYLTDLPNRSDNRVLSGQHIYYGASDTQIANINSQTGKYVALMGVNYYWDNTVPGNNLIINWSNNNGIVTIYPAWLNPNRTSETYDEPIDPTPVTLSTVYTSGNATYNKFRTDLVETADGLETLSNAGAVVILRIFPEMAAGAFWWAGKPAAQYKLLWQYVFNYLTVERGLHNLLFIFAPNCYGSYVSYYPGNAYVDLVGMDTYPSSWPSGFCNSTSLACYNNMVALGKPFALSEFGPCDGSGCTSSKDYSQLITQIKACQPKVVYWMSWAATFSMDSTQSMHHTGVSTLLNDSWVITRDEVAYYGGENYALKVSKAGTGTGTVTSSPTGINCGSTCSYSYASGTSVTLTATTTDTFTGWQGGGCSGTGTCTVTMNAATSVIATFTAASASSTHWVSSTGEASIWESCAGDTPLSGTAACALSTANTYATAGNTVYLRVGDYTVGDSYTTNTGIKPANSGTSGNMITFKPYADEVVNLIGQAESNTVHSVGIWINGKKYIKVTGTSLGQLNISKMSCNVVIGPATGYAASADSSYNEISYVTTTNGGHSGWKSWFQGNVVWKRAYYNHIHHNEFGQFGYLWDNPSGHWANVFDLGVEFANEDSERTEYNILEDNEFFHGGHAALGLFGKYNIIRNNYFHNEPWFSSGGDLYGYRGIISDGYPGWVGYTLIEGNRIGHAGPALCTGCSPLRGGTGVKVGASYHTIRYNEFVGNQRRALDFYPQRDDFDESSFTYVYNNTFLENGNYAYPGESVSYTSGVINFNAATVDDWTRYNDNVFKNNLFYKNANVTNAAIPWSFANNSLANAVAMGNNRIIDGENMNGGTSYVAETDPTFTDETLNVANAKTTPNLVLVAGSPAINAGIHLTTAVGAGTGSTTLVVADARYFNDGNFGLGTTLSWPSSASVSADYIAIGTVGNTVKIGSINYTTNTITLASAKTWSNGASIWLYKKSDGTQVLYDTAPDMGAHEYTTGGTPDTTAPTVPANLTATALSYPQINLNWTASTDAVGVTGYSIFRCVGTGCTPTVQLATTASVSHQDINLTASTVYVYGVKAYDAAGNISVLSTTASATTPTADTNIALGKTPSASSYEGAGYEVAKAVDGSLSTRWSADVAGYPDDPQWYKVDLGGNYDVTKVILRWEAAYGTAYTIQYSTDDADYTTAVTVTAGDGGEDSHTISPAVTARYIKINMTSHYAPYYYSLYEVEVYGTAGGSPSQNIEIESCTLTPPVESKADELASGGYYVHTGTASSGTAVCDFTIATTGWYKFVVMSYGASAATDSFTVEVDSVGSGAWHFNPTADPSHYGVYREDEINRQGTGTAQAPQYDPYLIYLTAGAHTITFTGREVGARIDYFRPVGVSVTEQYTLTYTKAGTGTGTVVINGVNCSTSCSYNYDSGTPITITGTAGGDSTFAGWSGGLCTGTDPCTFDMTEARAVTGTFTLLPPYHTLTITPAGTGLGTVTSSPVGISCGATCAFDFTEDTTIRLTPVANSGSTFTGWTGDCSGATYYDVEEIGDDVDCTATFGRTTTPSIGTNFTLFFGNITPGGGAKFTLVK